MARRIWRCWIGFNPVAQLVASHGHVLPFLHLLLCCPCASATLLPYSAGTSIPATNTFKTDFSAVSLLTSPPLLPPSPPFDHTPPAIGMCVRRSIRRQKGLGFQRRGRMSSGEPRRRVGGGSVLTKITRRGGGASKGRGSRVGHSLLFCRTCFFFFFFAALLGHLNHDGCLHACSKRGRRVFATLFGCGVFLSRRCCSFLALAARRAVFVTFSLLRRGASVIMCPRPPACRGLD